MSHPRAIRRPYSELSPADYKLFLLAMREDRFKEYPIVGWQAIGEWLVRMKYVPRVPDLSTMYRYKRFGMPVTSTPRPSHGMKRLPWVTNLMLQAWLATQGRALTLPRWHPFRVEVENLYSKKPSAIRMRRAGKRRRLAQIKAEHALAAVRLGGIPSLGTGLKPQAVAPSEVLVAPPTVPAPLRLRRLAPAGV